MGKIMSYNSDHLNQTSGKIGQASTKAINAQTTASSKFTGMSSLFGPGVGEISKQLGQLSGSLGNVQGIMTKHSEGIFNMDNALAKAAAVIEIPQDFVKNDANRFTEFHDMLLEKLDGKAVNDGKEVDVKDNLADSGVAKTGIYDLTTGLGDDLQVYDATSAIAREQDMGSIVKVGGEDLQKYDVSSVIARQKEMGSIAKAGGAEEQKYNDASVVHEGMLTNINNAGGMAEQKINDASNVNAQQLGNVNNRIELTEQDLNFDVRRATEQALNDMSEPKGVSEEVLSSTADIVGNMGLAHTDNESSGK